MTGRSVAGQSCGVHKSPLATASAVIYATLVLLIIAIPRGLANWSKSFEPNPAQELLLRAADALESLSRRTGADWPYVHGREAFLLATGKSDD